MNTIVNHYPVYLSGNRFFSRFLDFTPPLSTWGMVCGITGRIGFDFRYCLITIPFYFVDTTVQYKFLKIANYILIKRKKPVFSLQ